MGRRPYELGRDAAFPEEQDVAGKTLEEALAWCLAPLSHVPRSATGAADAP